MVKLFDNMVQKQISDIKFHQNHIKLCFSMVLINNYINHDPKQSKTGLKWFKMIQNDSK